MAGNEIFNDLNLVLQLNQHIECVTNATRLHSTAAPSGSLTKQTSFNVLSNLKSVSYSEPREDAQFDHQRSIFLSESSSDLPFHLQGDKGFNEASAMAKRRALRFSESIKTRIEFLWEVAGGKKRAEMAQRIRQQPEDEGQVRSRRGEQSVRRTAANDTKQLLPPLEQLDEEDYVSLMLLIFKVLRDDFVLELAHKQIQCDWEVDSHHGKSLSFDQFFAAVFELVDVWTCDVEEATYERFLHLLAKRITRRVAVFLDGAEIKLSLSDNFEPEVIVKAIPLRTIPKFASIARVVAAVGIRTVGELARADPKVIEQERVDFIQRNSGNIVPDGLNDIRKLSQDLQSLIAMFKTIALQFENLNYTLENNVLRRVRTAAGPRPQADENRREIAGSGIVDRNHPEFIVGEVYTDSKINGDARSLWNSSDGSMLSTSSGGGNYHRSPSKTSDEIMQALGMNSSSTGNSSQFGGSNRSVHVVHEGNLAAGHSFDHTGSNKRSASMTDNTDNPLQTKTRTRGASESSADYFQPINNFHDLHNADSNVVNVLRSTFLIEKAISIQRQTEISAIRSELVKFGVELEAMLSDEAARDRYNALYDILVLRDGESIKALAAVMLEQIKLALSAHGITISDEEDPEEVYDGFYTSVVTGTGDSIVQEAQRWIEETVQDNKVHEYIQHDFHELNSIDEVKLLGTEHGDEEFIALLAKDEDTEDEVVENTSKTGSRTNSSPIQRKSSQVAVLPKPPVPTSQENPSSSPIPMEEPLLHVPPEKVVAPVKHDTEHDAGEKKKKSKKKKSTHEKAIHTPVTPAPAPAPPQPKAHTPVPSAPAQSPIPTEKSHQPDPSGDRKEKPIAPRRKPKLTISTQFTPAVTKPIDEIASLGPPVEATSCATPDDGKRNKPTLSPRIGHSKAEIEIDAAQADKTLHDSSEQHTARDALNVAIEFEEDDSAPGASSAKVDGERPISMEPKVPKIVIGGSSSAKNVPVTGRYIQLLGLGTVTITKIERDFFQLLQSQEGADTDLVCFDIGTELDTALTKLDTIQRIVGNRVILFGGNADEPAKTQQIALECLAHGALYFATIPFDFPRLREKVMSYFENSPQPYILRQRKPPGQTAQVGTSIGSGSLFALHDMPRKISTSVAFAKTPRRKLAAAISALPSLTREVPQSTSYGSNETRRTDFSPIAPSTPRPSQSRNRASRLSTTMNKLIR